MKAVPRVLVVDDDDFISTMLGKTLRREGYDVRVETSGAQVMSRVSSWAPAVVMLDIRLPGRNGIEILEEIAGRGIDTQVVMLTADDTAETAVRAMKLGAADYFTKPFNTNEVKIVVRNLVERCRLQREVACLRRAHEELVNDVIVGQSPQIEAIKAQLKKMGEASIGTLLLTGESGTGKELFAHYAHRLIHGEDGRCFAPFVRINCAALPDTLLESELFGYAKGAFTDARTDKKGLFELAHGGTILLDEIGEMQTNLQSKLLRVLEERCIRRLGASEETPITVTVIATTNRDLQEAVKNGAFRTDLFFRLNAFALRIPALRERREDVVPLADHFIAQYSARYNRRPITAISPESQKHLMRYRWPGNIRELRNVIERIVVLENSDVLLPQHLPAEITAGPREQQGTCAGSGFLLPEEGVKLEDVERWLIVQALNRARYNRAQAARLLGISYDAIRYQIRKYGLDTND